MLNYEISHPKVLSLFFVFNFLFFQNCIAEQRTDWHWHQEFPWIYSDKEQDWHYLKAGTDGKFYLYKNSLKAWYFFDSTNKLWTAYSSESETENISEKNLSEKQSTYSNYGTVQSLSLVVDGISREYLLYIPSSYDGKNKLPILFNFHGFGGTATDHMNTADMRTLANTEKFILVYPQGSLIGGYSHWNASPSGGDNKSSANDTGFFEAMLTAISSAYKVDSTRVYACGYSNGGFFSYFLAGNNSNLVAAVGSVSGTMLDGNPTPANKTPVISIHGTSDTVVPFTGGSGYTAIPDVLSYWANENGANPTPITTNLTSGYTTVEKSSFSDSFSVVWVEAYKIIGGEHVWFKLDLNGSDTNQLIWNFFSKHNLNGPISTE